MTRTFLVDLDTDTSTDFAGIADELKETLDAHFFFPVVSVKFWQGKSFGALPTLIPPSPQNSPPAGPQS